MPMLVPSPPFSLITTAWSSAARAPSGSSGSASASGSDSTGSISDSGSMPCSPAASRAALARERLDGDLRQALRPHLLDGTRPRRRSYAAQAPSPDRQIQSSNPRRRNRSPFHPRTRPRWPHWPRFVACPSPWWMPRTVRDLSHARRASCSGCSRVDARARCQVDPGRRQPPARPSRRRADGSAESDEEYFIPFDRPSGVRHVFETGEPLNITDAANSPVVATQLSGALPRGQPAVRAARLLGRGARGGRAAQRHPALVRRGGGRVRLHDGQPGLGRPGRAGHAQPPGRPGRSTVRARASRGRAERAASTGARCSTPSAREATWRWGPTSAACTSATRATGGVAVAANGIAGGLGLVGVQDRARGGRGRTRSCSTGRPAVTNDYQAET